MIRSINRPLAVSGQTGQTLQINEQTRSVSPGLPANPLSHVTPSPAYAFDTQTVAKNALVMRNTGVAGRFL